MDEYETFELDRSSLTARIDGLTGRDRINVQDEDITDVSIRPGADAAEIRVTFAPYDFDGGSRPESLVVTVSGEAFDLRFYLSPGEPFGTGLFVFNLADPAPATGGDDVLAMERHADGGLGDDTLLGTMRSEVAFGGAGLDVLSGEDGDDTLHGEGGADLLLGGGGDDLLDGGRESDVLRGAGGQDTLLGGGGTDALDGGVGRDLLRGGPGADRLSDRDRGDFADTLDGGDGDDTVSLYGAGGADLVLGGAGNDRIYVSGSLPYYVGDPGGGGAFLRPSVGDDTLRGGEGDDTIELDARGRAGERILAAGGDGDDLIRLRDLDPRVDPLVGPTDDTSFRTIADALLIEGFAGADRVEIAGAFFADDMRTAFADGITTLTLVGLAEDRLTEQYVEIERAVRFEGRPGDVLLYRGLGNGSADDRTIIALERPADDEDEYGRLTLFARDGASMLTGGARDDTLTGSDEADRLDGAGGDDVLDAGDGADTVTGGAGDDRLYLLGGDDVAEGGDGHDTLFGGAGDDSLSGGAQFDMLYGGEGDDTLEAGNDANDYLEGGDGDDVLRGGDRSNLLLGEAGADLVFGGGGSDRVSGGVGADELHGDDGADRVFGGEGDDILFGGDGADRLIGGAGDDVMYGDGV